MSKVEVIPRVVVREFKYLGIERISSKVGLETFVFAGSKEPPVDVEIYKLMFKGLLAQEETNPNLILLEPGTRVRIKCQPWKVYCRWHNGPIDREDNPLLRKYCIRPLTRETVGYCSLHEKSIRALYDRCLSSVGVSCLSKCLKLDEILDGKINFIVYIIDYGGSKIKVGVTREFRLLHRVSEQPHVVAKVIYKTNSAYEARKIETMLSHKLKALTERPGDRNLASSLSSNLKVAIARISNVMNNIARMLGENAIPKTPLIKVTLQNINVIKNFSEINLRMEHTYNSVMEVVDYWGGYLFLEAKGKIKAVKVNTLLHHLDLIVKN